MPRQTIPRPIGNWTATKLEHLGAYLGAFAKATKTARERYYIDAMAGCGECRMRATAGIIPGSAWHALNSDPGFTGIHLIELDRVSAQHLMDEMRPFPQVHVYEGDCNLVVPNQVLPHLSRIAPTLAFLDSTGVEPTWGLVRQLADHRRGTQGRKLELLILYAWGMFINRWLRNEPQWPKLDAFYGERACWHDELVRSERLGEEMDARTRRFVTLYVRRLEGLGYKYVEPHGPLKRGRQILYYMIFATDDPNARRIMSDVWARPRPIPGTFDYKREFRFVPRSMR